MHALAGAKDVASRKRNAAGFYDHKETAAMPERGYCNHDVKDAHDTEHTGSESKRQAEEVSRAKADKREKRSSKDHGNVDVDARFECHRAFTV